MMDMKELKKLQKTTFIMINRNIHKSKGLQVSYCNITDSMLFNDLGNKIVVKFTKEKPREKFFEYMERSNDREKVGMIMDIVREWIEHEEGVNDKSSEMGNSKEVLKE